MTRRAFSAQPETAALFFPITSVAHPQHSGMPLGYNLRTHAPFVMNWWDLATHSTVFRVEGVKNTGKTAFMTTVCARFMMLQSGAKDGKPQLMRARINSRKSENGQPEFARLSNFLHSPVFDLAQVTRINVFDRRLITTEPQLLEIAINIAETVKESRLTGKEAPAIQVAVHKMFSRYNELMSPEVLEGLLRGLTKHDRASYYQSVTSQLHEVFAGAVTERPELQNQLTLLAQRQPIDDDAEFMLAATNCADYFGRLLRGDYGNVFGATNSLYDMLTQQLVTISWEGVPTKAKTILESLLLLWQTYAITEGATKAGLGTIIPHLSFSDEEGETMTSDNLMHVRAQSAHTNKARAYPTASFAAMQYATQGTQAGSADSEVRSLGKNIERGIGARFVFKQPDDDEILQQYTRLGMSDLEAAYLPHLRTGEAAVLIPDHEPVFYKHCLSAAETPLVKSNTAREDMLETVPFAEDEAYLARSREMGFIGELDA